MAFFAPILHLYLSIFLLAALNSICCTRPCGSPSLVAHAEANMEATVRRTVTTCWLPCRTDGDLSSRLAGLVAGDVPPSAGPKRREIWPAWIGSFNPKKTAGSGTRSHLPRRLPSSWFGLAEHGKWKEKARGRHGE